LHSKASERCEEKSAHAGECKKRKGTEENRERGREREIKKELVSVCRCASVCVALREGWEGS